MLGKIKSQIYQWIIWSQKYTKTDNVYIIKHGFYLYSSYIITFIAGFLMAMAYARYLPKQIFGEFKYLLSILTIIGLVSLEGITSATTRAVVRGYEANLKKGVKIKFRWALIGSGISLTLAGYYFWQSNISFGFAYLIMALFLPLIKSFPLYTAFLEGKKLFNKSAKYKTVVYLLSTLSVLITIFLTDNLVMLVLVYFISNVLFNFLFYLLTVKKYKPNKNEDSESIRYGRDLSFIGLFSHITRDIDKIIVFHFLGAPLLAIYHFADLPLRETTSILKNLRILALPKFSSATITELKLTLLKKIFKLFVIIVFGVILFIALAPYLYQIFFPQYMESVRYSRWLFLAVLGFPFTLLTSVFEAQMKKREYFTLSVSNNIIYIIFLFLLIPSFGIMGLIASHLIKTFFGAGLSFYLFKKL